MTRWCIEGTLVVREGSALHIGSGESSDDRGVFERLPDGEVGSAVDVSMVATDCNNEPLIPGTSLKGVLRSWLKARGCEDAVKLLFGELSKAGLATFENAFLIPDLTWSPQHIPYWNAKRKTGVSTHVAIDRRTRSSAAGKLYHVEFVPAGATFRVRVEIGHPPSDAAPPIETLLAVLAAFSDPADPVTLGAETGDGWGRMTWRLGKVRKLADSDVRGWLRGIRENPKKRNNPLPWRDDVVVAALPTVAGNAKKHTSAVAALGLDLSFEGSFLVNDPTRAGKKGDPEPKAPNHMPLWDDSGRAYLPASSLRGALRSQAERILRTVAGPAAACSSASTRPCIASKTPKGVVVGLCPACILFGATGWRSPLRVTPFRQTAAAPEAVQDFLAIDAFTGGAARHLKFDAKAPQAPVLRGSLELDLARLAAARGGPWSLGLVALLVRDLIDGEISFGFGAAKGYGWCRATPSRVVLPSCQALPGSLVRGVPLPDWAPGVAPAFGLEEWKTAIRKCVTDISTLSSQEGGK